MARASWAAASPVFAERCAAVMIAAAGALGTGGGLVGRAAAQCQLQHVTAEDAAPGDTFGLAVALSADGSVAVVGAFQHDAMGDNAGCAYLFRRIGPVWVEEAQLLASDGEAADWFGRAVAIAADGETVLIGAPREDEGGQDAGAAYGFRRAAGAWVETGKLIAPGAAPGDEFGFAVAISAGGDTAVIGAWRRDQSGGALSRTRGTALRADPVAADAGAAHVFTRSGDRWTHETELRAPDAGAGDAFGIAVALSAAGDHVLIGAPADDNGGGVNAGAAYVFHRIDEGARPQRLPGRAWDRRWSRGGAGGGGGSGGRAGGGSGGWGHPVKLLAPGGAADDWFGESVAMSIGGDRALIGARLVDAAALNAGAAYLFDRVDATWGAGRRLLSADPDEHDEFGAAVALSSSGDAALIGAYLDDEQGQDSGAAYLFADGGASWPHLVKLRPEDRGEGSPAGGEFGHALALGGDTAIIGAWVSAAAAPDAGAASFFVIDGPDCNASAQIDACDIRAGWSDDRNGNLVPDECENPVLPGDADGDGDVDHFDLMSLLDAWGLCPPQPAACPADLDGDGEVNVLDLLALLANWG
jgi:hypothetical protein